MSIAWLPTVPLDAYLERAASHPEKRQRVKIQHETACEHGAIVCGCGIRRGISIAYRCLYCGEWFCAGCAQVHFGESLEAYWLRKNVELAEAQEKSWLPRNILLFAAAWEVAISFA